MCNLEDKFLKICKFPLSCTHILVEASTVCMQDGRKDILEVVHCMAVREAISVHTQCDIILDAL